MKTGKDLSYQIGYDLVEAYSFYEEVPQVEVLISLGGDEQYYKNFLMGLHHAFEDRLS